VFDYELDDWALIPCRGKEFSSSLCIPTGSGTHPASIPVRTNDNNHNFDVKLAPEFFMLSVFSVSHSLITLEKV
jgi:hypothetical protein